MELNTRQAAAAVEDQDARALDILEDERKLGCEAGLAAIVAAKVLTTGNGDLGRGHHGGI